MDSRAVPLTTLGAMLLGLWPATTAKADDQQLVQDYLQSRGVSGAVGRPVTDDFVGRTFPNFSFFGVIFRQYPVTVQCPQATDLKCANLFFVQNSQVDFISTIEDLKFFFAVNLAPAPTQDADGRTHGHGICCESYWGVTFVLCLLLRFLLFAS